MASDEELTRRIIELAAEMGEFYPPKTVPNWFFTTQPYLEGRRPIDMIADNIAWMDLRVRVQMLRDGAFT